MMLEERRMAILEELSEVESLPELNAIVNHWSAEHPYVLSDEWCVKAAEQAAERLSRVTLVAEPAVPVVQVERLRRAPRSVKKYRLLSTEVGWSTRPQVHAIAAILGANIAPGEVVTEEEIIRILTDNREVLNTSQPVKVLWDYYKGRTSEGLLAHGNIAEA